MKFFAIFFSHNSCFKTRNLVLRLSRLHCHLLHKEIISQFTLALLIVLDTYSFHFWASLNYVLIEHSSDGLLTWHRGHFRAGVSSLWFPLLVLHLFTWYHHKISCQRESRHPGVSSARLLYRGENFTLVRNLATVSCKREMTANWLWNWSAGRLERVAHV